MLVSSLNAQTRLYSDMYLGIDYAALAYTTQHGFAAVGSNNGHNGTTGKAFFHNPDVVADFAGRS
jgi:feruloyl esterase